jgi:hypothetical protein
MTIAILGVLLDVYLTEQWWANKPPYSTGPVLVGTLGLFFIFPIGVLISIFGVVVIVYASKRWPRVQELLDM